jgi:DNA repair protein SbcC/Rad50
VTLRLGTLRQESEARQGELAVLDTGAQRIRDRLAADLAAAADQRTRALRRLEAAVEESGRTLEAECAAILKRRDDDLAECAAKVAGNEKIRGMADVIRAAVVALAATEAELVAQRAAVDQRLAEFAADRAEQARLAREGDDVRALVGELDRARSDATLMRSVPCGGIPPYDKCRFLTNAAAAAALVPALEVSVRDRQAGVDAALQPVLDRLAAAQTDVDVRRRRIQEIERQQAEHQKWSKYAEALAAAEARIAELSARQEAVRADAATAVEAARARAVVRDTDHARRLEALAAENAALAAAATRRADEAEQERLMARAGVAAILDRLEAEHAQAAADLEAAADGNARALAAQADLTAARRQWDDTTRALAYAAQHRDALGARRTLVEDQRRRAQAIHARRDRLVTELLEWQLLAKTFSRDGLPVLEIDAAGPTISTFTNELLEVCFGSRFTVDLVTQQAKADGKGLKESFTIEVTDNQTGESRDIADLSGGEQTLVGEALMNGIAIFVNTRSRMPLRTCWRDETTGALDPANAVRYVEMLRKVQQLGGFHQILFVSHNPDCTAMADVQLLVADGAVTVVHPPFTAAERAA